MLLLVLQMLLLLSRKKEKGEAQAAQLCFLIEFGANHFWQRELPSGR